MRFFHDQKGFSLVELMIAVLVMTVGLTGVAAMQTAAMNGTFLANAKSSGAGVALAWTEWLNGLMSDSTQPQDPYFEDIYKNCRRNFVYLAAIDHQYEDTNSVEVVLPSSLDDIVDCFNGVRPFVTTGGFAISLPFWKAGGIPFIAADMPPPAPAGSRIILRIAANVPVINTATIEVSVIYSNAFVRNRGSTLHFVVASNM